MGSWNETCAITNLPIFVGDRIMCMIMARTKSDLGDAYSADSILQPVGLPFVGEYDDYGSIENVECPDFVSKFILSHEFIDIMEDCEGEPRVRYENLDEVLEKISAGDLRLPSDTPGGTELILFMAHEYAYTELLDFADVAFSVDTKSAKETPSMNYRRFLETQLMEAANGDDSDDPLKFKIYRLAHTMNISPDIDGVEDFIRSGDILCEISNGNNLYIKPFVDYMMFRNALAVGRRGFWGISGKGSQCDDMAVQIKIAEITIELGKRLAADK